MEGADLHALGLLCLWKKSDPDTPAHALATHLTPSAFSFSPLAAAPVRFQLRGLVVWSWDDFQCSCSVLKLGVDERAVSS